MPHSMKVFCAMRDFMDIRQSRKQKWRKMTRAMPKAPMMETEKVRGLQKC